MEKRWNNNPIGVFILLILILIMLFVASWNLGESPWLIRLLEPEKVGVKDYTVPYVPQLLLLFQSILFLGCVLWLYRQNLKTMAQKDAVEHMGRVDALTGLLNRRQYQNFITKNNRKLYDSLACIYIDANGLHELNNTLGHTTGDKMLKAIAAKLIKVFGEEYSYRIGGDEFVVFCVNSNRDAVNSRIESLQSDLEEQGYNISVGVACADAPYDLDKMINEAEREMYEEKSHYYREHGNVGHTRNMDWRLEEILREKRDADSFLSIISSYFMGVYMVNLVKDDTRIIYRPAYFNLMLQNTDNKFKPALEAYIDSLVVPEDREGFKQMLDYERLVDFFEATSSLEYHYTKTDGDKLIVRVCKAEGYSRENLDTCWIFETSNGHNNLNATKN